MDKINADKDMVDIIEKLGYDRPHALRIAWALTEAGYRRQEKPNADVKNLSKEEVKHFLQANMHTSGNDYLIHDIDMDRFADGFCSYFENQYNDKMADVGE